LHNLTRYLHQKKGDSHGKLLKCGGLKKKVKRHQRKDQGGHTIRAAKKIPGGKQLIEPFLGERERKNNNESSANF